MSNEPRKYGGGDWVKVEDYQALRKVSDELLSALEEVMRAYGIYDKAVAMAGDATAEIYMDTGDRIRAAIAKAKEQS